MAATQGLLNNTDSQVNESVEVDSSLNLQAISIKLSSTHALQSPDPKEDGRDSLQTAIQGSNCGNEIDEASVPLTDVLEQRSHDLESLTEKAKRLLRTSEDIVQTLEATVQTLEAIVRPLEAVVQERRGSRSPKTSKERRLSRGSVGKEHVEDPSVQVTQNATSGEYSECSRSADPTKTENFKASKADIGLGYHTDPRPPSYPKEGQIINGWMDQGTVKPGPGHPRGYFVVVDRQRGHVLPLSINAQCTEVSPGVCCVNGVPVSVTIEVQMQNFRGLCSIQLDKPGSYSPEQYAQFQQVGEVKDGEHLTGLYQTCLFSEYDSPSSEDGEE